MGRQRVKWAEGNYGRQGENARVTMAEGEMGRVRWSGLKWW